MRKYIVGALFGFLLSLTISAHAEVKNLVGAVIEGSFPVTLNGSKLQEHALVVGGTGYLPIRAIGEALNLDIAFSPDLGIELKKKEDSVEMPSVINPAKPKKPLTVDVLEGMINEKKTNILSLKMYLDKMESEEPRYKEFKERLAKYESELAELEKQKAELEAK